MIDNNVYATQIDKFADEQIEVWKEKKGLISDKKPKKYVLYLRKSTKGKKQARSLKDQKIECRIMAKREKIKILKIYREKGSARRPEKRSGFTTMIKAIKSGRYNSIVAWHPDRLVRNMKEAGEIIDLIDKGLIIDLKFPTYYFSRDPSGVMSLGIQFVIAKNYSDNLAVSVNRGNSNIAREGKFAAKVKYGYTRDREDYAIPDEPNFYLLQEAFKMALGTETLATIADYLNEKGFSYLGGKKDHPISTKVKMTPQKLSEIFSDLFYAGIYVVNGEKIIMANTSNQKYRPMVSQEEFMELRCRLDKTKAFDKKRSTTLILQKMVFCGYCNHSMTPYPSSSREGKKQSFLYIKCSNQKCPTNIQKGLSRQVRGKVVLDYACDFFAGGLEIDRESYDKYLATGFDEMLRRKKELGSQSLNLNRELTETKKDLDQFIKSLAKADEKTKLIINKRVAECKEKTDSLQKKLDAVVAEHINIKDLAKSRDMVDYEKFSNFFKNVQTTIKNTDNKLLVDQILRTVFSNFIVKDGKVQSHTLNPHFEEQFKSLLIHDCRRYRIRTCNLAHPMRAR